MTIEQEYIDLIQADIDGELSGAERARLSSRLLADPEARAYAEDLREICGTLDRMGTMAPPAGLTEAVNQAIAVSAGAKRGGSAPVHLRRPSQALRYAAAFAGGAMLSAIAFHVSRDYPGDVDIRQLVGTMAADDRPAGDVVRADELRVAVTGVDGAISLFESGPKLVVVFDLDTRRPLEIQAATSDRKISLTGETSADGVRRLREAVAFEGDGQPGSQVAIRLLDGHNVLFEGVLRGSGGS